MISTDNFPSVSIGVHVPTQPLRATRDLAATGQTTVISVSEEGIFLGLGFKFTAMTGTVTFQVEITIDGGSQENVVVVNAANVLLPEWQMISRDTTGLNGFYVPLNVRYDSSLLVVANCVVAGSAGSVEVAAYRATKQ